MGWITVKVMKRGSSGQTWPLEYCTVAGSVAGFFGGMTCDFKTDDRGIAEVSWESSKDLGCLYIKGRKYKGPFESGRSYTIVVD